MKAFNILGVKVNSVNDSELNEKLNEFLESEEANHIVTVNPEIVLHAQKDEEYFYIINHSALNVPDGIGLKMAGWILGANIKRIIGVDLAVKILKLCEIKKVKVAIVNWREGLSSASAIRAVVEKKYPTLDVRVIDIEREWNEPVYKELQTFQPQVILSTLGAPYQEKWIFHFLKNAPYVRIAVGVGGTFDFFTGTLNRAPQFFITLGLEWLWRLKEQPHRWRRIFNATFVFACKFIIWRFILPHIYRPNVACLLYKKDNEGYKILLVEREDWPGHWQLPQGGTEGMSVQEAGIKELIEEINNHDFRPVRAFPYLWKYDFRIRKYYENKRHNGYRGQKQALLIAEFFGKEDEIKVNYWDHRAWKWVRSEDLTKEIHERRQESAQIYLKNFNALVGENNFNIHNKY